jgi:hypothetical protein
MKRFLYESVIKNKISQQMRKDIYVTTQMAGNTQLSNEGKVSISELLPQQGTPDTTDELTSKGRDNQPHSAREGRIGSRACQKSLEPQ